MLTTVNELRRRGVRVVSLTENFDLETKEGRFMFAVLAAAEGRMLPGKKHIGRPRVLGPAELATLRSLVEVEGVSVTEAARTLKVGRTTAYEDLQLARNECSTDRS